ncbi:MAG: DUF4082 domain-containing protein [Pseudobdellovibrionaceae bacterium]
MINFVSYSQRSVKKYIPVLISVLVGSHAWGACDQTLSPGANLATAFLNAAAGSTICLNAGTYDYAEFNNISKDSDVTIQSVSGRTASVNLRLRNANHLKLKNLTVTHLDMDQLDMTNVSTMNKNISVINNTFVGQMRLSGSGETLANLNIVVDGNTFDGINICTNCSTGRLQLWAISGVQISNNHFGGGGTADGIQWGGYGGTVGPGNVFDGIVQSAAGTSGAHIDSIQLNGGPADSFGGRVDHGSIIGNYFGYNTIDIMAPDGANAITVKDNVFTAGDPVGWAKIQMGTHSNDVFTHNILIGIRAGFNAKYFNPPSTNAIVKDNIMIDSSFSIVDSYWNPKCDNCIIDHNLFTNPLDAVSGSGGTNNGSNATSTNSVIGIPTFSGGANVVNNMDGSQWSGYKLTTSSVGYKVALDGLDMGPNYYGSGAIVTSTPTAPAPAPAPVVQPSPSSSTTTLGYTSVGTNVDTGDSNSINASRFVMGSQDGAASSISIYAGPTVSAAPNNLFQVAIYADANGMPGNLVASSASSALVANSWNTVSISAPLKANTAYWLAYNANGLSSSANNIRYSAGSANQTRWMPKAFGSMPSTFANSGTGTGGAAIQLSIYVNYSVSSVASASQTLLTSQIPKSLQVSDGSNVNYELGMRFYSTQAGKITSIRFYKSAAETGTHVGKIYSSSGQLLGQVTFTNETASDWQQADLAAPIAITANTEYTVSVNTGNSYYVDTVSGMASQITNGKLNSVVGSNGVYGPVGVRPTTSWQNSNYFRDIVFVPSL